MQIELDTVKGFRDFLPPESLKRDKIKKIVEKYYKLYGFVPIETPTIELDELMKPNTLPNEEEDEAISDRFRLKDRAGRNLGLRYEFTFQLARIFKQNQNIKLPFRRYQIGENYRDEPIKPGRTRQFTQCDADIIGDSSVNAEAELLSLVNEIFKELGLKEYEVRINNRKLLNAIIESVEITESKKVMKELDKIEKVGEDVVKVNLKKYADSNKILTLFKLMEKPLEFFVENSFDGASEIKELEEKCKKYGVKIVFSPSLVRGFGYYTGFIFEFVVNGKNALVGGGRYDNSVGKYLNREIPAVGISFSIESIMGNCPKEIENLEIDFIPKALIISIEQDSESFKLTKKLRKENISCFMTSDRIGKALEYANACSIPYVIFVGEEEVKKDKFKIKNMKSGKEDLLTEKQMISSLS